MGAFAATLASMLGAKNVNPIDYMPYEKAATIKPPQEISLTDLRRLWENG